MRATYLFAAVLMAAPGGFFMPKISLAADATAVINACDRTPGCGYTQNPNNGDISGCSKNACFYCPADGKHQCIGVGAARTHTPDRPRPGGQVKISDTSAPTGGAIKIRPLVHNSMVFHNEINREGGMQFRGQMHMERLHVR